MLLALRHAGIHVVALHNHMTGDTPNLYFTHFWGKGQARHWRAGSALHWTRRQARPRVEPDSIVLAMFALALTPAVASVTHATAVAVDDKAITPDAHIFACLGVLTRAGQLAQGHGLEVSPYTFASHDSAGNHSDLESAATYAIT